jgi:hypothetical protein
MTETRPATIILDLDGCVLWHYGSLSRIAWLDAKLLPGVREQFDAWERAGCKIILLTGRKESMREKTERDLQELGLFWDTLVMGVGGGPRYLINDKKSDGTLTAFALNVPRNKGLEGLS